MTPVGSRNVGASRRAPGPSLARRRSCAKSLSSRMSSPRVRVSRCLADRARRQPVRIGCSHRMVETGIGRGDQPTYNSPFRSVTAAATTPTYGHCPASTPARRRRTSASPWRSPGSADRAAGETAVCLVRRVRGRWLDHGSAASSADRPMSPGRGRRGLDRFASVNLRHQSSAE